MGYILLSHCPKGSHWTPQTSQFKAKAIGCSQSDGKTLLLKTMLTYAIEHGEVELVPN